jgi:hypothetical protein
MQSPSAEWTLAIGHLAVLDYLRARGDADHDTISEVTRNLVARHPRGEAIFTAALIGGALWFHAHIVRPLHV